MTRKERSELRELIEKGLKRSALKARVTAWRTNTPRIVEVNGRVRRISVTEQDIRDYRKTIEDALR